MLSTRISLSKKAAAVSFAAEVIYTRIIPHADDAGRITGDLEELRAVIIPLGKKGKRISLKQLRQWLEELHNAGLITLYSKDEKDYVEVTKFGDFQTIKGDRSPTVICPDPADGILWNPTESNGIPSLRYGLGLTKPNNNTAPNGAEYPPWFEECWNHYPRKKEKRSSYNQASKRIAEGTLPEDLLIATIEYEYECRREGLEPKYVKLGKTFFGPSKPFEDYLEAGRERANRLQLKRQDEESRKAREQKPPPTPEEIEQAKQRAEEIKAHARRIAAARGV